MRKHCHRAVSFIVLLIAVGFGTGASAEERSASLNVGAPEYTTGPAAALPEAPREHRFWDSTNRLLFSAVAATCGADFAVTRANLASGGQELNPITRVISGSTAGLAMNFVGETAATIGLSYYLHRTGHHRLERWAPVVNIGSSAAAVAYGLTHR